MLVQAYGVVTKGNGDAFINPITHTALSVGGGQAGQGYPCVLEIKDDIDSTVAVAEKPEAEYRQADLQDH